jgi:hypothetical protein
VEDTARTTSGRWVVVTILVVVVVFVAVAAYVLFYMRPA